MKAHDAFGAYAISIFSHEGSGVVYDTPLGSIADIIKPIHQIPEIDEMSYKMKRPDISVITKDGMEIYELKPISCKNDNYKHKKAEEQLGVYTGFFYMFAKGGDSIETGVKIPFSEVGENGYLRLTADEGIPGLYYYEIDDGNPVDVLTELEKEDLL